MAMVFLPYGPRRWIGGIGDTTTQARTWGVYITSADEAGRCGGRYASWTPRPSAHPRGGYGHGGPEKHPDEAVPQPSDHERVKR
jgi:hypothetical protein